MRIKIEIPLVTYIDKSKLQETYETLLAIRNLAEDTDEDSILNRFFQQVEEKLNYLKYREAEISDRLQQDAAEREIRKNERERQGGHSLLD